jgi:TonB family protein
MFTTPTPVRGQQRITLLFSFALHCVPVVLLVLASRPIFVAPSSVNRGHDGTALTHLYWPDASADAATTPSPMRISLPKAIAKPAVTPKVVAQASTPVSPADQVVHAAAAGASYGSASEGPFSGHDIRPALPMSEHDPIVNTDDLPGGAEGTIVVEITIDAGGNVVSKSVLQSLGPTIDNEVLSALDSWHFRPATRDGTPIASKQDVVYHFKPR